MLCKCWYGIVLAQISVFLELCSRAGFGSTSGFFLTGCGLIVYPGAFNMTTGPKHWTLLQRARAVGKHATSSEYDV